MCEIVRGNGGLALPLALSGVSGWYRFLYKEGISVVGDDVSIDEIVGGVGEWGGFDTIIIVDTNSYMQLPVIGEWIKGQNGAKVLVIDHHKTSDGLGDVEIVDTSAAATGEIVLELIKYAGWELSESIAEGLFTAIATDTGWFRYGNSDKRLFNTAAELVDAGVDASEMYKKLYQNSSEGRIKLMARMLENLELYCDGKVAYQQVLQSDFDDVGAKGPDTENLIDECQRIGSVEVAILVTDLKNGSFKCSLRSKGSVNVREVAQKFGGGGHDMASGCTIKGGIFTVKKEILEEMISRIEK